MNLKDLEKTDVIILNCTEALQKSNPSWTFDYCYKTAFEKLESSGGIKYYVLNDGSKLGDISPMAKLIYPAEYFVTYEEAKIYQYNTIITSIKNNISVGKFKFTKQNVRDIEKKLNELIEEFPEYTI